MANSILTFGSAAALIAACASAADGQSIHIAGGRSHTLPWAMTDGAGYTWNITNYGAIESGSSGSGYSSGMRLRVNGSYFSWSGNGSIGSGGREIEVGPWSTGTLRIWRRIYVDPKLGYCRWIDIFENAAGGAQSASVRYNTSARSSVQLASTTSGAAAPGARDWGVVTAYSSDSSSTPALVHVFASSGAKVKPRFQFSRGSTGIYCNVTLTIPAGKPVALCLFEAQRRRFSDATKFLANFNPVEELEKVPAELRRLIVNMKSAAMRLGTFRLPRNERHDLAVLRNNNELLGTILNERFVVEAFYKRLDLPAERVLGVNVPSAEDPYVQVGLVDGQVVAGRLLSGPVRMKLINGSELSLAAEKIKTVAYRVSPGRPKQIKVAQPVIVLRSGEQLFFERDEDDYAFHTEHGTLKLNGDDLRAIHLDTPAGGLHRAIFRNGSVVSGLLAAPRVKLRLENLGATLDIRRQQIERFVFGDRPSPNQAAMARVKLRNEDVLLGRLTVERLTVQTRTENVVILAEEVAKMDLLPGTLAQAVVRLHSGTTVSGRLVNKTIPFRIEPGPEVSLFAGHIITVTRPKPPPQPRSAPAGGGQKKAGATTKPRSTPTSRPAPTTRPGNISPALDARVEKHLQTLEKDMQTLAAMGKQRKGLMALWERLRAEAKRQPNREKLREMLAQLDAKIEALSAEIEKLKKQAGVR